MTRLSFTTTRFAFSVTRFAFTVTRLAFTPRLAAATRTVFRALTLALLAGALAIFGCFGVNGEVAVVRDFAAYFVAVFSGCFTWGVIVSALATL